MVDASTPTSRAMSAMLSSAASRIVRPRPLLLYRLAAASLSTSSVTRPIVANVGMLRQGLDIAFLLTQNVNVLTTHCQTPTVTAMPSAGWDTASYLWPDPRKGPFAVWLHFAVIDGRAECVGVEVRSFAWPTDMYARRLPAKDAATEVVSAEVLRSVRVGELVSRHRDDVRSTVARYVDESWPDDAHAAAQAWGDESVSDRVRAAAQIYMREYGTGRPTKAVEQELLVSYSAAAKLVQRARDAGLLPATTRGRARIAPAKKQTARSKGGTR